MRESRPMPGHHLRCLGAHALADVGDLVGEADFHGQECVGGVLDHLRAGERGGDHRHAHKPGRPGHARRRLETSAPPAEIQLAHDLQGALVAGADHDAVRIERIGHRASPRAKTRDCWPRRTRCASVQRPGFVDSIAHQGFHQVAADPTGTVDLLTTTRYREASMAAPMLRAAASRYARLASPLGRGRRAHGDENHLAFSGRAARSVAKSSPPRAAASRITSS